MTPNSPSPNLRAATDSVLFNRVGLRERMLQQKNASVNSVDEQAISGVVCSAGGVAIRAAARAAVSMALV